MYCWSYSNNGNTYVIMKTKDGGLQKADEMCVTQSSRKFYDSLELRNDVQCNK